MSIYKNLSCLLALLTAALSPPAFGLANIGSYSFLRNSPAELFSADDWALFEATLMKALNANDEGEVKTWENPKSQYSGEIMVIKTVAKGTNECRAVRITSQAADRSRSSVQIFCRKGLNGDWKLEPAPSQVK